MEPEENEQVVGPFLAKHPDWTVEPPATPPGASDPGGFVRFLPHRHGTDGFTAIRLRREPQSRVSDGGGMGGERRSLSPPYGNVGP